MICRCWSPSPSQPGRPTDATANLVSPILINRRAQLGKQVVLENQTYSHKQRILNSN